MVAVLVPQLRDAFDATTAGVALSIPAYLVPFAALQLVSGTLGERLGRRRVVRTGYIAYAFLSVLAAFVPDARRVPGRARAAGLRERVPDAAAARRARRRSAAAPDRAGGRDVRGRADGGGRAGAAGRRRCSARSTGGWRSSRQAVVAAGLALMPPADGKAREERAAAADRVHAPGRAAERGVVRRLRGRHRRRLPRRRAGRRRVRARLGHARRAARRLRRRGHRCSAGPPGTAVDRYGRVPVALRRHRGLLGARRVARLAPVAGRARRAVVRHRARLDARLGRDQHARGGGRARQPGGRDVGRSRPSSSPATRPRR